MCEEMWEKLGNDTMLICSPWPTFDASKLVKTSMTIVVAINGKRAADFVVGADASESEIVESAKNATSKKLADAQIIKTIFVPNKMVNFVVKR